MQLPWMLSSALKRVIFHDHRIRNFPTNAAAACSRLCRRRLGKNCVAYRVHQLDQRSRCHPTGEGESVLLRRGPLRRSMLGQPCTEYNHNSPLSVTPPTIHPMKLPGELMIFGCLSPTLITTYDTILYDTPFEEQFRFIGGLSSCQDESKGGLMSRGPHIKRLVILLPLDNTNASDNPDASDDPSAGDDPSANDNPGASDNSPSAGSAIPAETKYIKPILEGLAVCPQLAYIHWDCRHPFTPPLRSDYPRLQNFTRLDWYFTLDTIRLFVRIVKYSPTLEYITIPGCVTESGSALAGTFTLPASVTTIEICFLDLQLDAWIKNSWRIYHPITLVAMVSGRAFKFLATKATRIDLRPDPRTSEEEPAQALGPTEFERYLTRPPHDGERGTLAYSVIFFAPPSDIRPEEQEWVEVIALRTSGRSRMTEGERWNTLLPRLDLISRYFPSLQTIYLYYDFHSWRDSEARASCIRGISQRARDISRIRTGTIYYSGAGCQSPAPGFELRW